MISGLMLAQKGVELANRYPKILYSELDCQGFMEEIFSQCGKKISYRGSNDMYRNACIWVGTLDEAKRQGCLQPGAALFILEQNGGEPDRYKADGKGNASHVGMYVGEGALVDVDKNGVERSCNVVHSSSSMGRVAGSTLKNGWTHVGLWLDVDFDVTNIEESEAESMAATTQGKIITENLKPVNFRTKTNSKSALIPRMPEIPYGAIVEIHSYTGDWAKVSYQGYTGYVMKKFIGAADAETFEDVAIYSTVVNNTTDDSIGSVEDKATLYRVYIDFTSKKEAQAFQKALQGAQIGSVK